MISTRWVALWTFRIAVIFILLLSGYLPEDSFAITPEANYHYQRATQLDRAGNFPDAEREYRLALSLDPSDSLTYLKLAHLLERRGGREESMQLYYKALELNPSDSMIHISIAQLWESKNNLNKALEHYRQFLNINSRYPYVYLSIARVEKELKHYPQAIEAYQIFLNSYSKHLDAQRELASLLLSEKQFGKAAELYSSLKKSNESKFKDDLAYGIALNNIDKSEEALAIFNTIRTPSVILFEQTGIAYEKLNRLPDASQYYKKAVELDPKEKYSLYLKVADLSMTMNQQDSAIDALKAYLNYDPDNGKVAKSLADLYLQQKAYSSASSAYENALKNLPNSETELRQSVLQNMGYAYQMQDNPNQAIDAYEKALAFGESYQTRLNLALAHHKQGNYLKALELYRKLLVADPSSVTLRKDMGQVLLALAEESFNNQDYNGAMSYYQDALLLGGTEEAPALLGLANTQYALKDYQMAYTMYQRVLEKEPENATARLNKAQLDLDRKNYMEALENLRWIVEKKPDYLNAYKLLAQAHEGLGDYGQAILYYQKSIELAPKDSALLMGYGNAWRQVGDLDRAQHAYEMARTESPENAMVRYNLGSVYNQKNNLDASLTEYREAIKLNPSFTEPYYGMGTALEKQKKLNEALETYQMFISKAPLTSSYLPLARERIELLKKTLNNSQSAP